MKRYLLISLFLLFIAIFSSQNNIVNAQENQDHVPGQVLVKFKDNTPKAVVDTVLKRHNGQLVDQISGIDTLVVNVPNVALDQVITALSKNPNVEYAEANSLANAFDFPIDAPNDTYYLDNQWGLENISQTIVGQTGKLDADIDAQAAWQLTTGGTTKVAILDTGIDQAHPDLSVKIDLQQNFSDSPTIDDLYGHGTHVSGIVAAITNNAIGVAGVCPSCRLLNGKVLNDKGSGAYSWIANGIIWAVNNQAKVINMSLGGPTKSATLENAINYAWTHGVVIVAAAGNSANPSKTYPGAYTNVIAVAATNNLDKKTSFSSYGNWVDVAAPGENIFSTFPTHSFYLQTEYGRSLNYDFGSGTSMATPMVSATAALIWSTPYGTSNSAVRARLEKTADKIAGTGTYWSYGRINAARAVSP